MKPRVKFPTHDYETILCEDSKNSHAVIYGVKNGHILSGQILSLLYIITEYIHIRG